MPHSTHLRRGESLGGFLQGISNQQQGATSLRVLLDAGRNYPGQVIMYSPVSCTAQQISM